MSECKYDRCINCDDHFEEALKEMTRLEKRKERMERWKEHCEAISQKVKLNENRSRESAEYAKHRYSD